MSIRLEIPREPEGRKPAVITLADDTETIRRAGFVAVTYKINWRRIKGPPPPLPPPEQRVGTWVLASPSADVLGESYLRGIAEAANDYVPKIVDWVAAVPEIDPTRIAMVGGSTNGFTTLQALAADHRLVVAVVITACGDYHRFLRESSMGMAGKPLRLGRSYEHWIRTQEVERHPDRVVHAALLMVNRAGDPLIPISCAETTAKALARAYAKAGAPDRFRYVRLPTEGHGIGPDERRETMEWLRRWLRESPADASRNGE